MAGIDCLPEEINIFSLNCWGIPYVSRDRSSRLEEIGRQIVRTSPQPHIVGLQECFSSVDFERIKQETRSILPYSKQYFAGPLGAGLVLLSRWPIEETSMTRYPLSGSPTALIHGDWYAGKGVAYARIRYGEELDNVIDVFNTHLHAFYPGNEYLCHRVSQAWELSKLLRAASQHRRGRALVVLLGDLNTEPTSLPYHIFEHFVPDMHDTWLQHPSQYVNPPENGQGRGSAREEDARTQSRVTYGSPQNTWMWTRAQRARSLRQPGTSIGKPTFPEETGREQAMCIDYIFASVTPLGPNASPQYHEHTGTDLFIDMLKVGNEAGGTRDILRESGVWTVKSAKVGMTDRHPVLGCSLSDHFSVETTLKFQQAENRGLSIEPGGSDPAFSITPKEVAGNRIHVQELQEGLAPEPPREPDTIALLDEILRVLENYRKVLRRRVWWRRARLGVAGTVLAGSLVGVWVLNGPGWARFLLALAGVVASAFAALDIWGGLSLSPSETAALAELEWEVKNSKRGLASVISQGK